jgi:uncharacterized phage-associated protein
MESQERTPREVLIDRLLLLFLLVRMRQKGYRVSGDVKLHKLLYKVQERMFLDRYKGLNHTFIFWKHGPFSQEIYSDTADLRETHLLRKTHDRTIDVSEDGAKLVSAIHEAFRRNSKVQDYVERVVNEFGPYSGKEIKAVMYSYPKVGERKPIGSAKPGEFILGKLDDSEARDSFWLDDEWLETLEVLFDPSSYKSMTQGLKALREEKGKPFVPILE